MIRSNEMSPRLRRLGLAAVGAGLLAVFGAAACQTTDLPVHASGPVRILGTLVAAPADGERGAGTSGIELPDVRILLLDGRGQQVDQTVTALDGRFSFDAQAPGSYRICYELRSVRACRTRIQLAAGASWFGEVATAPQPTIRGTALTGDGRPCWVADSFFGLDVSTRVEARPAGAGAGLRPAASVRANTQGEYALFGLADGTYAVTATCEAAIATVEAVLRNGSARRDLAFANRAPSIRSAAAFDGQRQRGRALVGQALDLRADVIDRDGDTIQYMWRAQPHAGQLTPAAGGASSWRLPAEPGLRHAYLIARDGKGGFAYSRVDMEVGREDGVAVSGRVLDEESGRPVEGATVAVGAARARTDRNGWFALSTDGAQRHVVNVSHSDYGLTSRIIYGSARGATFELTRAQVSSFAAGEAIRIVDTRSAGFCGGDGEGRMRPFLRRAARTFWMDERKGDEERRFGRDDIQRVLELVRAQDQPCVRRGAEIVLPANALVDSNGRAASGTVRAAVTTLNPARRALPGEYRAITRSGEEAGLLSFGAVDVRFEDAGGRALDLRSGVRAEIRIPVPPSQVRDARPTMPLWSYDEARGIWVEGGEARLERSGYDATYVGRASHFSVINVDNPDKTLANVTCLRFTVDPAFGAWTDLKLRAYVGFAGASTQVGEVVPSTTGFNVIYTIPYKSPLAFPWNTVRLELRGKSAGVEQVLLDNVINTDARPKMTGSNIFPPSPYVECGIPVDLTPPLGIIPSYPIDGTNRPIFLTGKNGAFNPQFPDPQFPDPQAYYQAIAGGGKTQLGQWWAANGFDGNGLPDPNQLGFSDYQRASYMNNNDLGLGRDMHCLKKGPDLACYVTNYGLPDQNHANATAAATQDSITRGATVAMEFKASDGPQAVQFYVYGGGISTSQRIDFADLDGFGPKPVPYLCMVCHGGGPNLTPGPNPKVANAFFREFDPPSFIYPGGLDWKFDGSGTAPNSAVQPLGPLNRLVRDIHPTAPIGSLINAWYPANNFTNAPVEPTVSAIDWPDPLDHHDLYATSCRTCHIARPTLLLDSRSDLVFTKFRVCGGTGSPRYRVMPNAVVTYRNFWLNSGRVTRYENIVGQADCEG